MPKTKKKVSKRETKKKTSKSSKKTKSSKESKRGSKKKASQSEPVGDIYDDVAKDREKASQGNRSDFWRPAVGSNPKKWEEHRIRLVPFSHNGRAKLFAPLTMHWGIEDGKSKGQCICIGENCPICAFFEGLDKDQKKKYSRLRARMTWLFNVIPHKSKNVEAEKLDTIHMGEISKRAFDEVTELIVGDEKVPHILDLKKGRPIILKRKGKQQDTEYRAAKTPRPVPVALDKDTVDLSDHVETRQSRMSEEELETIVENLEELVG